jgi:hypothetical protein
MAARAVALELARRFLQSGNFVLAGAQGHGPYGALPAAAAIPELPEYDEYGFAGLAVQPGQHPLEIQLGISASDILDVAMGRIGRA